MARNVLTFVCRRKKRTGTASHTSLNRLVLTSFRTSSKFLQFFVIIYCFLTILKYFFRDDFARKYPETIVILFLEQ